MYIINGDLEVVFVCPITKSYLEYLGWGGKKEDQNHHLRASVYYYWLAFNIEYGDEKYTDYNSVDEKDSPQKYPEYDNKQSDGEAPGLYGFGVKFCTLFFRSLPGPCQMLLLWIGNT